MIPPFQSNASPNPPIIAATSFFALINSIFQYRNGCANITGILAGAAIGLLIGSLWFLMWWYSGSHDLLFYNELLSNNAICTRPSRQTFKCEVWRGGQLITQSTI